MSTIPEAIRPVLEQMRRTQEEAAAASAVKAQAYDVVHSLFLYCIGVMA